MISLFTNICANDSEEKNSDVKVNPIRKQSSDFSLNLQITDFIPNIQNINIFNHINGISPQTFILMEFLLKHFLHQIIILLKI